MARATREREAVRIAQDMRGVEHTINMYRELLTVAQRYGNEYEVERLTAVLDEYEAERDSVIEQAIAAGLAPGDI
jgi:hypothetical protein